MTSSRVTHILGVPEEERGRKFIKEIMAKTFPNLEKEKDMEIKEVQRVPKQKNPKRFTPRHIIIKMTKVKDKARIFKAARENQFVTYKGIPRRLSAYLLAETLQAKREWHDIFKGLKGKKIYNQKYYI